MEIALSPIYGKGSSIAFYSFFYKKKKYVICLRTNKIFRLIGTQIGNEECYLKFSKSFIKLLVSKCSGRSVTSDLVFSC